MSHEQVLAQLKTAVDEELDKLRAEPPTETELTRVKNGIRASFFDAMETIAGKANQLNGYLMYTGNPDYFAEDLNRYQSLSPADVQAAVRYWLPSDRRLELTVLPEAKQ